MNEGARIPIFEGDDAENGTPNRIRDVSRGRFPSLELSIVAAAIWDASATRNT